LNRMSPAVLVRSLAAQCAAHVLTAERDAAFVPAFKALPATKVPSHELFNKLLLKPLEALTPLARLPSRAPMVLLIDALDEAGAGAKQRKPLLQMISKLIKELPSWVRVVITSKPELDIEHMLKAFRPFEIKEDDPWHVADIEVSVRAQLQSRIADTDLDAAVRLFMERCEGRFVYVATVMDDLLEGLGGTLLSLKDLTRDLPEGLDGAYRSIRMRLINEKLYDDVTVRLVTLIRGEEIGPSAFGANEPQVELHC
jgi:hypothetical protein